MSYNNEVQAHVSDSIYEFVVTVENKLIIGIGNTTVLEKIHFGVENDPTGI